MEKGKLTNFSFIEYLLSVQDMLSEKELEDLRQKSAFSKEVADREQSANLNGASLGVQRHKAGDLYAPIGTFRELGLPVIDWGVDIEWNESSEEGKFLMSCCWRS